MKLWGGRFTKEENQLVHNFNESLSFDQRLYRQDIEGSIAHVTMLARQGIVTEEDREAIVNGLSGILSDVEAGNLGFSPEYEDIHSFVEANLIERIGEAGKRLHTGRSREGFAGNIAWNYGGKSGHLHAWIYPFAESSAHYACSSHGSIF